MRLDSWYKQEKSDCVNLSQGYRVKVCCGRRLVCGSFDFEK